MAVISLLVTLCQSVRVLSAELACLETYCPAATVNLIQIGDGHCDPKCLSPMCNFDSLVGPSDCQSLCGCETLGDGTCDLGKDHSDCNSPECRWDAGDCSGYCSPGCRR